MADVDDSPATVQEMEALDAFGQWIERAKVNPRFAALIVAYENKVRHHDVHTDDAGVLVGVAFIEGFLARSSE